MHSAQGWRYTMSFQSVLAKLTTFQQPQCYAPVSWPLFINESLPNSITLQYCAEHTDTPKCLMHMPGFTNWQFLTETLQANQLQYGIQHTESESVFVVFDKATRLPLQYKPLTLANNARYEQTVQGVLIHTDSENIALQVGQQMRVLHKYDLAMPEYFYISKIQHKLTAMGEQDFSVMHYRNQITLAAVDNTFLKNQATRGYDDVIPAVVKKDNGQTIKAAPLFDPETNAEINVIKTVPLKIDRGQLNVPIQAGTKIAFGFVDGQLENPIVLGVLDKLDTCDNAKIGLRDYSTLSFNDEFELSIAHSQEKPLSLRSAQDNLMLSNPMGSCQLKSKEIDWMVTASLSMSSQADIAWQGNKSLQLSSETIQLSARDNIKFSANETMQLICQSLSVDIANTWRLSVKDKLMFKSYPCEFMAQQGILVNADTIELHANNIHMKSKGGDIKLADDTITFEASNIVFDAGMQCHWQGEIEIIE